MGLDKQVLQVRGRGDVVLMWGVEEWVVLLVGLFRGNQALWSYKVL